MMHLNILQLRMLFLAERSGWSRESKWIVFTTNHVVSRDSARITSNSDVTRLGKGCDHPGVIAWRVEIEMPNTTTSTVCSVYGQVVVASRGCICQLTARESR